MIVLGVDAALRRQALDNSVEGALAGERQVEEAPGLVSLGLRADQSRRGPRGFLPETTALEDE